MKRRDLVKLLEAAGYRFAREGDHTNMVNPDAVSPQLRLIQVPRHREIVEVLAKKILRDAGLR